MKRNNSISKSNSGFTLVELIVTMAIMVIFFTALTLFFSYTMMQYHRNSDEVNLQHESQLCVQQLQNIVSSANSAVDVQVVKDDAGKYQDILTIYNYEETTDTNHKVVSTKIYKDVIYPEDNCLKLQEYVWTNGSWTAPDSDPEVFASYVQSVHYKVYDKYDESIITNKEVYQQYDKTSLRAYEDLSIIPTKVKYKIEFQSGKRTFNTTNSVAIRNTIVGTTNFDDIYSKKINSSASNSSTTD